MEESARKAEAEVANLAEQIPILVSEARALAVEEFKASVEMRDLKVQFGRKHSLRGSSSAKRRWPENFQSSTSAS